jgi:hypothetical protein
MAAAESAEDLADPHLTWERARTGAHPANTPGRRAKSLTWRA